jgi:hypothetical protein
MCGLRHTSLVVQKITRKVTRDSGHTFSIEGWLDHKLWERRDREIEAARALL